MKKGAKDSSKRIKAEAMANRARELKESLAKQQAASMHEEVKMKIQQWTELIEDWPRNSHDQLVPMNATSSSFSKRVKALCMVGIPPKIRGAVWPLLIGNTLNVARGQFEAYIEEVDIMRKALVSTSSHSDGALFSVVDPHTPTSPASSSASSSSFTTSPSCPSHIDEEESKHSLRLSLCHSTDGSTQNLTSLLRCDLPRTFPTLKFFHNEGYMRCSLERVLYAYALYAPETGYVQGMSFVAAMLLLNLDEADAFICLTNLLHRRGPRDFLSLSREHVDRYVSCFDYFFQQSLPLLFAHLKTEAVDSDMFLLDWYLSIFAKALPLEVAARVWDWYLAEGELFGLKISLGILRLFASKLCNLRTEGIMGLLMHLPEDMDAERLLHSANSITIQWSEFERVRTSLSGSGPETAGSVEAAAGKASGCTVADDIDGSNGSPGGRGSPGPKCVIM